MNIQTRSGRVDCIKSQFFRQVLGCADYDYLNNVEFGSMTFDMTKQKCNRFVFQNYVIPPTLI